MVQIKSLRDQGKPTVPSTIGLEVATNPFLRAGTVAHFADIRRRKDTF
jgi:hydroxyacylglutathione hydrolase